MKIINSADTVAKRFSDRCEVKWSHVYILNAFKEGVDWFGSAKRRLVIVVVVKAKEFNRYIPLHNLAVHIFVYSFFYKFGASEESVDWRIGEATVCNYCGCQGKGISTRHIPLHKLTLLEFQILCWNAVAVYSCCHAVLPAHQYLLDAFVGHFSLHMISAQHRMRTCFFEAHVIMTSPARLEPALGDGFPS